MAVLVLTMVLSGCSTAVGLSDRNSATPPPAAYDSGQAVSADRSLPALVVTNEPPPDVIYRRGSRDTVLADKEASETARMPSFDTQHVETLVTRKVKELGRDLSQLQGAVSGYQDRLDTLQAKSDAQASEYYALVAAIATNLQSGTTPGNPVLTERWNVAQNKLDSLAGGQSLLNQLATDLSSEASRAAFLQDTVRATYGLSGAVEEDHKNLRKLEDGVNQNIVEINRLLTSVSDEINRRTAYLRAEQLNMQTLSGAVAKGEMYGQSMSNTLFKKAAEDGQDIFKTNPAAGDAAQPARRPLVIIRFDRPNVNYEQPVYSALSQALEKYPSAKFDLVAVSATDGNPAEVALAETEARKNGEAVLRSLGQMGLPMERLRLSATTSKAVSGNEVHIYLR